MSNTNGNGNIKGFKYRVSNLPTEGGAWENYGNVFMDAEGKRGSLYLNVSAKQLKELTKKADKDGRIEVKVRIHGGKPVMNKDAPAEKPAA